MVHKIRKKIASFFAGFWIFLKNIFILFSQSFKEVMFFMLICSVFTAIATSVLESLLIKAMMKACGVTYIVPDNLRNVIVNPVSIILIIIFLILITLFSLFEIAGLLHAFSMAQIGRNTNLTSMLMAGFRACKKADCSGGISRVYPIYLCISSQIWISDQSAVQYFTSYLPSSSISIIM